MEERKQKCDLFKSAAAAATLSSSSDGINRIHLNESEAVWSLNKIRGIGYKGDDKEVISRIMIMEDEDKERAKVQATQQDN